MYEVSVGYENKYMKINKSVYDHCHSLIIILLTYNKNPGIRSAV